MIPFMLAAVLAVAAPDAAGKQPNTRRLTTTVRAAEDDCPRGCSEETGDCWRLLAELHSNGLLEPPILMYVGEPYPTELAASCGAKKLREYGACVALFNHNANVPIGRIVFTKDDEPYPGTDDCY